MCEVRSVWREDSGIGEYQDTSGFCKSVMFEEISKHGYVLTPGRYVGAEDALDDGEPFSEKMTGLTTKLSGRMAERERLDGEIRKNLSWVDFPI